MFGYAWSQRLKAVSSAHLNPDAEARTRAEQRAGAWDRVLLGMLTGKVRVGSPTPVRGFPDWLTPEILRGGFATGGAAAGGPLQRDEIELAHAVGAPESRAGLFSWFLTDAGLDRLTDLVDAGTYRLDLPEHGALLVVALLRREGDVDGVADLLRTLEPWADRIRFWPIELATPPASGVHVSTVPEVAKRLAQKKPQRAVEAEREALSVWAPFTDQVVEHWWATRTAKDGVDSVYPPGWQERAHRLLAEYEELSAVHQLTGKHADPKGNLQLLLTGFRQRLATPHVPPIARVQHAMACVVAKRGEPGSPRLRTLRETQHEIAARPSHARLAHDAGALLAASGVEGGVLQPEALLSGSPAAKLPSVLRVVRQATQAPLAELVAQDVVHSAESVATFAPDLTADVVASRYSDPTIGLLAKQIYQAFANRRSVLLVNRQSQVQINAIPWFDALERRIASDTESLADTRLAHDQAQELATLALTYFPGTMLPNSLIHELLALYRIAGEDVPLTYELAADIFVGSFSPVFARAAREAASVVGGTLYARYFDIDYAAILRMPSPRNIKRRTGWFRREIPEFDALAYARAEQGHDGEKILRQWSPAANGRVIEQAQILTTQNLAVLARRGVQLDALEQARRAWWVTVGHLRKGANGNRLRHRKNAALAWRQMIFFCSLLPENAVSEFIESVRKVTGDGMVERQASTLLDGLTEALAGKPPSMGPFLGWVAHSSSHARTLVGHV